MDVDLSLLEEVVDAADGSTLPFELGSQLYLTEEQFRRYREAADRLASGASRSIRRINELEAYLLPEVFGSEVVGSLGKASDAQSQLNSLLRNPAVTVRDAIRVLRTANTTAREVLSEIEGHLT